MKFPLPNLCTIARLLSIIAATLAANASQAEPAAESELRLEPPGGPFEQWKPIVLRIEGTFEGQSKDAYASSGIDVELTAPSGLSLSVPTYVNSIDTQEAGLECRFTPREIGTYTATVREAGEGEPGSNRVSFHVDRSTDEQGFLHVDRKKPYFMVFDNGEQFRGIGTNIGWEPHRRRNPKHSYDALFPRISENGLNTVRTWICPWNMPLDWNKRPLGDGNYDQNSLRRMDEMFALAEQNGLYVVLVLGYHGELQTVSGSFPNNDRWKENPYNVVNGGPCETPAEFFTSERAKAIYKQRLRMLVARVACQTHLLAWEFWNEIDHIERRGPVPGEAIVAWHQEMADYLRRLDVYDHPITTSISVKAPTGLWEIDNIDLIMLHPYGVTDKFKSLLTDTNQRYGKPAIAEEFSYSWKPAEKHEVQDFERELRLGLWRGLMSPTPVLPMTWWWEFHDSRDDWRYFRAIAQFSERMIQVDDSTWRPVRLKTNIESVECHGIVMGGSIFLWLRNNGDSAVSDIALEIYGVPLDSYQVKQFDTYTGNLMENSKFSLRADAKALILTLASLGQQSDTAFVLSR